MLQASIWQRSAIVVSCVLLLMMSLPSMMSPRTAFAQMNTPTVTIERAFTRDGNGNEKNTFAPGDAIQCAELVTNHNSSSVTPTFLVKSTDPNGNVIFSSQFNLTIPSGLAGVYTPDFVPKNAQPGTYAFQVTVTYNGASSQGQSQFNVITGGPVTHKSSNYAGYISTGVAGTYSDVSASWQVPTNESCGPFEVSRAAYWIGLDGTLLGGAKGVALEQIGVVDECNPPGVLQGIRRQAFYEIIPGDGPHFLSNPVTPGDMIDAEVKSTGNGQFVLSITNDGQFWNFSTTQNNSASTLTSAEWVVEAPELGNRSTSQLMNFGTVHFSLCFANGSPIDTGPNTLKLTMVDHHGNVMAQPSDLYDANSQFDVTWVSAGP